MLCAFLSAQSGCRGHEAHLSTQQPASRPHAWLSRPHAYRRRSQGYQRPSRQGAPSHQQRLTLSGSAPGGNRFRRPQRPLTPRQFQAVLRHGRRQRFGALEVITLHNDAGWPRLGLIIPKRQVRLAVRRNTLKRWIREAFRHRQQRLPAADIVVRVHGAALTHAQVDAAFEQLLCRTPS